jgi:hypothetical protein
LRLKTHGACERAAALNRQSRKVGSLGEKGWRVMKQAQIGVTRTAAGRRWSLVLAAVGATVLLGGCASGAKSYVLRTDFSVNVGLPADGWPKDVAKLSLAEQDAMRTKGRPHMIHVWWMPSGDLIDRSMLFRFRRESEEGGSQLTKLSWIYLSPKPGEEVIFTDQSHWRTEPLSDRLRTACEAGDPQDIQYRPLPGGEREEKWIYYNLGHIYRFVGDRLLDVDKSSFPPMPNYMTR